MAISITILIGVLSTFIMTVFMQVLGYRQRKSIPWLLGTFIATHLNPAKTVSQTRLLIWGNVVHYVIGIAFVAVYLLLWYSGWIVHSYFTTLIFGLIIGLIAPTAWYFILSEHPLKAFISYRAFLISIFISHLVFAFSMSGFIDLCMVFLLEAGHFPWMYV